MHQSVKMTCEICRKSSQILSHTTKFYAKLICLFWFDGAEPSIVDFCCWFMWV